MVTLSYRDSWAEKTRPHDTKDEAYSYLPVFKPPMTGSLHTITELS